MFNPKVINRAYHLAVIDDITVHWDMKTVYRLMIFSYVDTIQLKYHVLQKSDYILSILE